MIFNIFLFVFETFFFLLVVILSRKINWDEMKFRFYEHEEEEEEEKNKFEGRIFGILANYRFIQNRLQYLQQIILVQQSSSGLF